MTDGANRMSIKLSQAADRKLNQLSNLSTSCLMSMPSFITYIIHCGCRKRSPSCNGCDGLKFDFIDLSTTRSADATDMRNIFKSTLQTGLSLVTKSPQSAAALEISAKEQ